MFKSSSTSKASEHHVWEEVFVLTRCGERKPAVFWPRTVRLHLHPLPHLLLMMLVWRHIWGPKESTFSTSSLSHPMWAHESLKRFQGRSWPRQQWLYWQEQREGRTQRVVQHSGREFCWGLIVQRYRETMEESYRKGSHVTGFPPPPYVLWNLIWPVSF